MRSSLRLILLVRRFIPLFLAVTLTGSAAEGPVFPHPDRIRYDEHGFQIEGRDTFVYSGAFHYFRCPRELWRDRFQKIKQAGFNAVETYVPWNYHERQAPSSPEDFSKVDLGELADWMTMAEEFGFYIIIRPGPYICAEWAGGGYPQWLVPLFKPKDWPAGKVWLQTDDPTYLPWNKHWYDAVTRVVAPHQITRKKPGEAGVILFQIENEYERLAWVPSSVKTNHLAALARQARAGGIDVPIVTCWTRQSRNSAHPDLVGVFDFINSYPKWEIGKKFADTVAKQRKQQPYAPVAAMELQAGWYSEIGGKLSEQQDGVAPVQTQNLALFCLQNGYSVINYYMLVGGTNFDDWASREATASYDFFAPIRETGGVGEKYRRVAATGAFLREHGARLMRSAPVSVEAYVSDPAVQVTERRAADGTRYLFVRTEDRSARHKGTIGIPATGGAPVLSFDFALEPFGSLVLVLPPGADSAAQGKWFPKLAPEPARPAASDLPAPVVITNLARLADPVPATWTDLTPGECLEACGLDDYHPIYFHARPPAGAEFTVRRIGAKVIKSTLADTVLARVGDRLLAPVRADRESVTFRMPDNATEVVLLQENVGLHHHTTPELETLWPLGLREVSSNGKALPLAFASTERARGLAGSLPDASRDRWTPTRLGEPAPNVLLTWHRLEFELPAAKPGVWVPWMLRLAATGNGFIYLNGHCLGRTWQVGPQRDFFLPENWLHFGPGQKNVVLVSLLPLDQGVKITEAAIVPATAFAESQ